MNQVKFNSFQSSISIICCNNDLILLIVNIEYLNRLWLHDGGVDALLCGHANDAPGVASSLTFIKEIRKYYTNFPH